MNNTEKFNTIHDKITDGLKHSDMERVIFYFSEAHHTGCENDKKMAEDLLDNILHDFEKGAYKDNSIYHFASGIIYLLRNNFIEGNEDDIFTEIDDKAFRDIYFRNNDSRRDLYMLMYYLKLRISGNPDKKDDKILLKNKQHLCETLDAIGIEKQGSIHSNDRLLAEMEDLYQMGFARGLIRNILDSKQNEKICLKQINESEITFVIPVRIDFPERKRNLQLILELLKQVPNASVIILEADSQSQIECKYNFISYFFIEDHDPVFHRTKYINMMLSKVKTKIVGIWDTDVIVPYEQIIGSIQNIQNGCMMSFPYDGRFLKLSPETSKQYFDRRSISFLMKIIEKLPQGSGIYSTGGAFMVNKDEYLKCGGENEFFYGWGAEDIERVIRVEILGFDVRRTKGPLFHMYHPRTSWFDNNTEMNNRAELIKICSMMSLELRDYIKTWKTSQM